MLQDRRVILAATVDMRRDANRRMIACDHSPAGIAAHERAHQLHKAAERIARPYMQQ